MESSQTCIVRDEKVWIVKVWFSSPKGIKKARQGPLFNKLQRTQNYAYSIHRESAAERQSL